MNEVRAVFHGTRGDKRFFFHFKMPKRDDRKEVGGDVKVLANHVQSHAEFKRRFGRNWETKWHNSIVPFCFPISPEATFKFSMTLDMLCKNLDITSYLLPIVSFWHLEMEEKPFITARTVEYRAYFVRPCVKSLKSIPQNINVPT